LDPLRHLRDRGGMSGPNKRGVTQGGNPTGLELGRGCPRQVPNEGGTPPRTWHRPRSGSSKTRPIKPVPSRVGEGRVEVGEVGSGGGRSDSAKWKNGRGKWARVRVMRSVRVETT
jgi:hypothetical protein